MLAVSDTWVFCKASLQNINRTQRDVARAGEFSERYNKRLWKDFCTAP